MQSTQALGDLLAAVSEAPLPFCVVELAQVSEGHSCLHRNIADETLIRRGREAGHREAGHREGPFLDIHPESQA